MVTLPEDEATHLIRVLRLKPGDSVRAFDGRGNEWRAEVGEVTKKSAALRLVERVPAAPEGRIPISLAVAVLKGDKMDDVVRDAVMLGVRSIHPLLTERSETSAAALERGHRLERWQRIAVASAKQSGRAVVPPIEAALSLSSFLTQPATGARVMLVEPGPAVRPARIQDVAVPAAATLLVGPEGGWSEEELSTAQAAGASLVTMGGLTLRADAMPIVALTAVRTLWEDL
jgi:16S rRNA (uracil1498-N3)-methyltransferase